MFSSLSQFVLLSILSLDGAFSAAGSKIYRRSPPQANNVIVQLFEWPWDSVAAECTAFLGPAGYGYVQVSPANEHITGSQWWTDYQTVSYNLISKRGNRTQFANMVTTCANAGVGVIVDVVLNHMTSGSGKGIGGSSYSKYNYPAVPYTSANFHYCNGGKSASNINNYNDAYNVRFCELSGLADLAQEQTQVQQIMATFLKDLSSLGVAGFRVDAAKHMLPADLAAIGALLPSRFYNTQEVIFGQGEAVQPSQYVNTGDVIEFRATSAAQAYFTGSFGIAALVTPTPMGAAWGFVNSSIANYIMANQDTERGGTSLTSKSPNNVYVLSAIFLLGFNYGTPTVYSGYDYTSYDQGAPQSSFGFTNPVSCSSNGWRCEHRNSAIANMVAFHNAVGSTALTNIQQGTSQQIAFGRGSAGFLIINNDNTAWSGVWNTTLPAGAYCDIIHNINADPNMCSGSIYVVSSSGTFSASVASRDALALVIIRMSPVSTANATASPSASSTKAAPTPVSTTVSITFVETASTRAGEIVKILGSIPELGSWSTSAALPLTQPYVNADWKLSLTLQPEVYFEYKFIKVSSSGVVTWESGSNRVYTTPSAGSAITLYGIFGSTRSSTSAVTATPTTSASPSSSVSSVVAPTSNSLSSASSSAPPAPSSSSAVSTATSSTSMVTVGAPKTTSAAPPSSTGVTITFEESANTSSGEVIKLVGSISQLSNWVTSAAIELTANSNSVWSVTLKLPANTSFQYKFIRVKSGAVTWESDPNRAYTTKSQGSSATLSSSFR